MNKIRETIAKLEEEQRRTAPAASIKPTANASNPVGSSEATAPKKYEAAPSTARVMFLPSQSAFPCRIFVIVIVVAFQGACEGLSIATQAANSTMPSSPSDQCLP